MRLDVLLCAVGGQNVQPYLDFFAAYAINEKASLHVHTEKGFSPERVSERYSIRLGDGFGDIPVGKAQAVIALEQLEGLRHRHFVHEDGAMIMSEKRIIPIAVLSHTAKYPENCFQKCINDCFVVYAFSEENTPAYACLLALRATGEDKEKLRRFGQVSGLYTTEEVDRVFSLKSVKA